MESENVVSIPRLSAVIRLDARVPLYVVRRPPFRLRGERSVQICTTLMYVKTWVAPHYSELCYTNCEDRVIDVAAP